MPIIRNIVGLGHVVDYLSIGNPFHLSPTNPTWSGLTIVSGFRLSIVLACLAFGCPGLYAQSVPDGRPTERYPLGHSLKPTPQTATQPPLTSPQWSPPTTKIDPATVVIPQSGEFQPALESPTQSAQPAQLQLDSFPLPGEPRNQWTPPTLEEQPGLKAQVLPSQSLDGAVTDPPFDPAAAAWSASEAVVESTINSSGHDALISPYLTRAEQFRGQAIEMGPALPPEFEAWWKQHVAEPIGLKTNSMTVSLDTLVAQSLIHSPQVQVAAAEPRILETVVFEEAASFDWTSFWETKYDSLNDPVGNTLTTGNNESRFKQQEWYSRSGLRRKNNVGGELEVFQRLGYLDNNSRFLVPPDQGSSRLELNYRQPLLKGRGLAVNESIVLLANLDYRSADDRFRDKLQSHLSEVTESYWELFRARSELLQRVRLYDRAERILKQLKGRANVDALDRQIYRAEAAVANRQAEIARAVASIKNAESRLRLLVNEPELLQRGSTELMPIDSPSSTALPVDLADALATALQRRPDISQALRDLRAATVRLGVSRNDLLPKLDFLLGSYVAGLDADSGILNSWVNQFKDGGPGYNVGFEFEIPIGNRAAIARQQRREWELNQAMQQFRLIVETALTEVEIAVREVNTTQREMLGRFRSMQAAEKEESFLLDRWQTLPGIDDSVTLLLEDLLDAQVRLADEEAAFSEAQFAYAVATVKLKQAMGTLFQIHGP